MNLLEVGILFVSLLNLHQCHHILAVEIEI